MQNSWMNWESLDQSYGSQSVAPGPAASKSTESLLEMKITVSHSRPTESGTLGAGTQKSMF